MPASLARIDREITGQQVQALVALWMLRMWRDRDDATLIDVGFPTYDEAAVVLDVFVGHHPGHDSIETPKRVWKREERMMGGPQG